MPCCHLVFVAPDVLLQPVTPLYNHVHKVCCGTMHGSVCMVWLSNVESCLQYSHAHLHTYTPLLPESCQRYVDCSTTLEFSGLYTQ